MSAARADSSPSRARSGSRSAGQDRPRRVRPAVGGAQPGQRGAGGGDGGLQVGRGRSDDDRARAEPAGEMPGRVQRVGAAADDQHQPVAVHAGQQVEPGPAGQDPELVDQPLGVCRPRRAPSAVPTITVTGLKDQFSADAQDCRPSSTSPRTSDSTTSASSRASQAPRASAVRA